MALESEADELLYGGAGGGGKTDLLIGTALTRHRRSIIFRREYPQTKAILDRTAVLLGGVDRWRASARTWDLPGGRTIEIGSVPIQGTAERAGNERRYRGRPHDLKAFDEVTEFSEYVYLFLGGWARTEWPGQRVRIIAAGNPPTTGEGQWVTRRWAPWVDPNHPRPAAPGELRWYVRPRGSLEDVEVEGPAPVEIDGETLHPKSRTFVPSRVQDNPIYMETGYETVLQSLPEPLRSILLEGRFGVQPEDDAWQIFPREWLLAAQERWRTSSRPSMTMTSLGVDVARGGRDRTVLTPRWGSYYGAQLTFPGKSTPDGYEVAGQVVTALEDGATVCIDVVGVGTSPYDALVGMGVPVYACNGAEASRARDRTGRLGFMNKRAEWAWRLREALDPVHGENIAIPDDPEIVADLCSMRWRPGPRGIAVEPKDQIQARIGRSPDKGESLIYASAMGTVSYRETDVHVGDEFAALGRGSPWGGRNISGSIMGRDD